MGRVIKADYSSPVEIRRRDMNIKRCWLMIAKHVWIDSQLLFRSFVSEHQVYIDAKFVKTASNFRLLGYTNNYHMQLREVAVPNWNTCRESEAVRENEEYSKRNRRLKGDGESFWRTSHSIFR
uniref:Uncharacterized protein n=1 Tax=Vespula pensylvanica TaxID=30213 RepID=A0A834P5J8_VESPE|nr:hypothetical protein H0235_005754 [Vespula pensylvanica]